MMTLPGDVDEMKPPSLAGIKPHNGHFRVRVARGKPVGLARDSRAQW